MLEVLRYIAYIALNACVKYCTKDQSNVKGVKGTLYRFQCIKCYVCVHVLFPSLTSSTYIALQKYCTKDQSNVKGVKGYTIQISMH